MNTHLLSFALRPGFQEAILFSTTALLLSSSVAVAQTSSKTQGFNAAYTAPATGSVLGFSTDANGAYFNNSTTAASAGSFGTYGVINGSNGLTGTATTVNFDPQIFQKSSAGNLFSFEVGSLGNASLNPAYSDGFTGGSTFVVNFTLTNAITGAISTATITINSTNGANSGPLFLAGNSTTSPIIAAVTGVSGQNTAVATSTISRVDITLPNFADRTTVAASITINTSRRNILVLDNVTISSSLPLPVELSRFGATAKGKAVNLNWATASEKNNDRFDVQRSATGEAFETIGSVKGNGNSTVAHEYSFVDKQPLTGLAYYRLKQVDNDGTIAYSPVAVAKGPRTEAMAFPNPSEGQITLAADLGPVTYRVYNNLGQSILHGQATGGERLNVSGLPKGPFFLELTSSNGRTIQRLMHE